MVGAAVTQAPKPPTLDYGQMLHVFLHAMLPLWPLGLIIVGLGALRLAVEVWKARRLSRAGILEIDRMDGTTFEHRLVALYRRLGYEARHVGAAGGDFGADLIVSKDGESCVIQAKCWRRNVGIKAVQEVVGARSYYGTDAAAVVTNSQFTPAARKLASKTDVVLWDREHLVRALLETADGPDPDESVAMPAAGASCALCGSAVSEKVRSFCAAHAERFGGLTYCYDHQRGLPA